MRVIVRRQREAGQFCASYAMRRVAGDLHLTYRTSENRRVSVLELLGADRRCPSLYDPRLVELGGTALRFVGYERADSAWVMQEWICELV
jgi:hypothetical protein